MFPDEKIFNYNQIEILDNYLRIHKNNYLITNGCFDLIHSGHIHVLEECYKICPNIVLFINTDEAVRELKGSNRPHIPIKERLYIMASIMFISFVVPLPNTRLYDVFERCTPKYWAKGGDYTLDTLDQKERLMAVTKGIDIKLIPPLKGKSTTNIVDKIRSN